MFCHYRFVKKQLAHHLLYQSKTQYIFYSSYCKTITSIHYDLFHNKSLNQSLRFYTSQKKSSFEESTTTSDTKQKLHIVDSLYSSLTKNTILTRLLPFLWPDNKQHKTRVVIAVSALILSKLATIQAPLLLGSLIDTLCQSGQPSFPSTTPTQSVIDMCLSIFKNESSLNVALIDPTIVLGLVTGYGLARISSSGFNELRNALFSHVSNSACTTMACNTFEHLHKLDLDFLLHSKSGELTTILSRGIRSVTQLLNIMLFQVLPTILEFCLVLSLLTWKLGPLVAGITTTTMICYLAFTTRVTAKRTLYRKLMNKAEQKSAGIMIDSLTNAEAVRFFMNETFEKKRYEKFQHDYETGSVKVSQSLALLNFGQQVIFNIGLWSAMGLTAVQISSGSLPVGSMAFVSSLLFQLAIPLNMLGSVYRETKLNLVDLEKLQEILSLKPKCISAPNAKKFEFREGGLLKFENVSFEYRLQQNYLEETPPLITKGIILETPTQQKENTDSSNRLVPVPIFSDLNIVIQPGWKVGIVGASGSGKTSLIKLLFRLFDPQKGRITFDGQDLKTLQLESFRQHIGIVPQDVVLFNDTILFNLKYGNPNATMEDVILSAKRAKIFNVIMKNLPNGFDTLVGERGMKLSGGEKQRIGIARCLLRNPRIVILDEATSALDSTTEHQVLESFNIMAKGRTSIVIAHRLSTITDGDRIYVLGNGCVQEFGTHKELLEIPNGQYATMWNRQRHIHNSHE